MSSVFFQAHVLEKDGFEFFPAPAGAGTLRGWPCAFYMGGTGTLRGVFCGRAAGVLRSVCRDFAGGRKKVLFLIGFRRKWRGDDVKREHFVDRFQIQGVRFVENRVGHFPQNRLTFSGNYSIL